MRLTEKCVTSNDFIIDDAFDKAIGDGAELARRDLQAMVDAS